MKTLLLIIGCMPLHFYSMDCDSQPITQNQEPQNKHYRTSITTDRSMTKQRVEAFENILKKNGAVNSNWYKKLDLQLKNFAEECDFVTPNTSRDYLLKLHKFANVHIIPQLHAYHFIIEQKVNNKQVLQQQGKVFSQEEEKVLKKQKEMLRQKYASFMKLKLKIDALILQAETIHSQT